jgi:alpha-tubulin suppressor-like RCC1 family protein
MTDRDRQLGLYLCALAAACSLDLGCSKAHPDDGGSNTNWLRSCGASTDCGDELDCICGSCTVACGSSRACEARDQDAVCTATDAPELALACGAADQSNANAICVRACETDADCGRHGTCEDRVCRQPRGNPSEAGGAGGHTSTSGGGGSGSGGTEGGSGSGGSGSSTGSPDGGTSMAVDAGSDAGAEVEPGTGVGLGSTHISLLSVGGQHACAELENGEVKCWGYNAYGQLGVGDTVNRGDAPGEMGLDLPSVDLGTGAAVTALAAGSAHTCALLDSGQVKCWGSNEAGTLGLGRGALFHVSDAPGEMGDDLAPLDLGTGRTAIALSDTCDTHQVKCWGIGVTLGLGTTEHRGDDPGEMGDDLPVIDLGSGRTVMAIARGRAHTCALLDTGAVKCWGINALGCLGLGVNANIGIAEGEMGDNLPAVDLGSGRTALAIVAGYEHSCALLDTHQVKCWGAGYATGLGNGAWDRGDGPGEMGDNLPVVDLGTDRTALALVAGPFHTCALLDTHALKCWGSNAGGQLGLGDTNRRGDEPGEMGDDLPSISLGTGLKPTLIGAGSHYTCALLETSGVKCWGLNTAGSLGLGDGDARGDEPQEMGNTLPLVDLGE